MHANTSHNVCICFSKCVRMFLVGCARPSVKKNVFTLSHQTSRSTLSFLAPRLMDVFGDVGSNEVPRSMVNKRICHVFTKRTNALRPKKNKKMICHIQIICSHMFITISSEICVLNSFDATARIHLKMRARLIEMCFFFAKYHTKNISSRQTFV